MRILLTYWLIPCLFFIKGFAPDFTGAGQPVNTLVTVQADQNSKAVFTGSQNPVYLSEFEVFNDETEDEYFSEKKKTTCSYVFHALYNFLFFKDSASFLNAPSSSKCIHLTFPNKYIFYRAILI